MKSRRTPIALLLAGVLPAGTTACTPDPAAERLNAQGAPPAAAMFSPRQGAESLDGQLERLLAEMAAAMEGEPDRLLLAEAITDGLMEAQRPFDWLGSGYDVEARLRQLQAMADRVVARLRRGSSLGDVEEDVETMVHAVNDLRRQMAAARGGPAPPTLDSLLKQDPMAVAGVGGQASLPLPPGVETPETANEPDDPATPVRRAGPLGEPVPDTTGR